MPLRKRTVVSMESEPSLALLLRRADRRTTARLGAVLAVHGVGLDQWHVLACLSDGGGRAMSELGACLVVPAPSMSKLIDGMVADNLVHRRVDDSDRRRVLVLLTPRGQRLHAVLHDAVEQDEADLRQAHGAAGLAAIKAALAELTGTLDASGSSASRAQPPPRLVGS